MDLIQQVKATIRDIADYPKPGILFKDITPLLADPQLTHAVIEAMVMQLKPLRPDAIAAVEARGFILGSVLAHQLGCKFVPVRKSGKLPYKTVRQEYALEYGTATIEMHEDAIQPGWRVIVHDDLLATGGTAGAAAKLIQRLGGEVSGFSFLVNLSFLPGFEFLRSTYGKVPQCLISY